MNTLARVHSLCRPRGTLVSHRLCKILLRETVSSAFWYRLQLSISSVPVSTVLIHRTGDSTRKQANSRGHNRLRSNEQTRLTHASRELFLTRPPPHLRSWGARDAHALHRLGTFGRGAPSADPGPSPPAPPRARARPASYARRPFTSPNHRGGRGRAWSESPGRKPEQDLPWTRAQAACAQGLTLAALLCYPT
jgi:hypothetical protein